MPNLESAMQAVLSPNSAMHCPRVLVYDALHAAEACFILVCQPMIGSFRLRLNSL